MLRFHRSFVLLLVGACLVPDRFSGEARAAETTRISLSRRGVEGDALSRRAVLRDDRYVAFVSDATTLVSGDANNERDVFLHDRHTLETIRVSETLEGVGGDAPSFDPALSANAKWIAFESNASNLVEFDPNGLRDIFVRDRLSGIVTLVSEGMGGAAADGSSFQPTISLDGTRIAFRSAAANLVADDTNGVFDVFVRDATTGVRRVSVASDGAQAHGISSRPRIAADGGFVVFESAAPDLVSGDTNDAVDVFIHDLETNETTRVSVATDGTQGDGDSRYPAVSRDGRFVAFESLAANLVDMDENEASDVFVHDRLTGETTCVSLAQNGAASDGGSYEPDLSGDGSIVVFASDATDLVTGDGNAVRDVYAHDRGSGMTILVSAATDGTAGDAASERAAIALDASLVAFDSEASVFEGPFDTNGVGDVFVVAPAIDPHGCRRGNVNAAAGPIADVVFVNASAGSGSERAIVMTSATAFTLDVVGPPSNPSGPARFVLYAWFGHPNASTATVLPAGIGETCLAIPLTGVAPAPVAIWNNIGRPEQIGEPTLPSMPAPTTLLAKPGGLGLVASLFFQGIILDHDSTEGRAAVTNGIAVRLTSP